MSGEREPLPSPLPSCQVVLAAQLPISSLHNQPRWKANVSLSLFEASDFKMFFFFHPSQKVERLSGGETLTYVSLWHSSPALALAACSSYFQIKAGVKKLTLDMIIAVVCRLLLHADNFPASLWVSGLTNTPQGHFRAIDFQQSQGEISGDVLLVTYGHFRVHMLRLPSSEAGRLGNPLSGWRLCGIASC